MRSRSASGRLRGAAPVILLGALWALPGQAAAQGREASLAPRALPPLGEEAVGGPYLALGLDGGLGAAVDREVGGARRFAAFVRLSVGYGHTFEAGWLNALAFFEGGNAPFGFGGGAKLGFMARDGFAVDAGAAWVGDPSGAALHVALGWFYLALEYRARTTGDAHHLLLLRLRLPVGQTFWAP